MFFGSFCALITPFRDNRVDAAAFQTLIERQIDQGTQGLVVCGTTGESATLSAREHESVTELCVQIVAKRIPVLAGTGSNSTQEAIALTRHAQRCGADGALIVSPYYNKPTQNGLFEHFKAIHDAVDFPLVLYNIPSRCGVDILPETLIKLAGLPQIVGVKDATRDLERPLLTRTQVGETFCQLSGEDSTVVGFLAQGGHGCISVTANLAPALCAQLHQAWNKQDYSTVFRLRDLLLPLHQALFIESSPGPVKYGASLLGLCSQDLRLPLTSPSPESQNAIQKALKHVGLLT